MLTTAQIATLKTARLADGNLTAMNAAGDVEGIVAYYNSPGTGFIWRPFIGISELNTAIVWSEFAALTVAKQNTYLAMTADHTVDATSANIRGGFSAVFGGVSITNITALAQRVPTRLEMVFTTANVCSVFGYVIAFQEMAYTY